MAPYVLIFLCACVIAVDLAIIILCILCILFV